jgi:hypothetical protein
MENENSTKSIVAFVIGGIAVIVFGAISFWYFFLKPTPNPTPTPQTSSNFPTPSTLVSPSTSTSPTTSSFPSTWPTPNPNQQTLNIQTKAGSSLTVNNFYKTALEIRSNYVVVSEDYDYYHIEYYPSGSLFIMSGFNENLQQARLLAENELLRQLKIPKEQACQLKVTFYVDKSVDPDLASKDFGLSFCPDGIQLPQ